MSVPSQEAIWAIVELLSDDKIAAQTFLHETAEEALAVNYGALVSCRLAFGMVARLLDPATRNKLIERFEAMAAGFDAITPRSRLAGYDRDAVAATTGEWRGLADMLAKPSS